MTTSHTPVKSGSLASASQSAAVGGLRTNFSAATSGPAASEAAKPRNRSRRVLRIPSPLQIIPGPAVPKPLSILQDSAHPGQTVPTGPCRALSGKDEIFPPLVTTSSASERPSAQSFFPCLRVRSGRRPQLRTEPFSARDTLRSCRILATCAMTPRHCWGLGVGFIRPYCSTWW